MQLHCCPYNIWHGVLTWQNRLYDVRWNLVWIVLRICNIICMRKWISVTLQQYLLRYLQVYRLNTIDGFQFLQGSFNGFGSVSHVTHCVIMSITFLFEMKLSACRKLATFDASDKDFAKITFLFRLYNSSFQSMKSSNMHDHTLLCRFSF